jgi:hypothetical protein
VSRGSSSTHAHNEEDMLSLVKAQLLRQQLLDEEQLFKHEEGARHEAKNIYNIECRPKIRIQYRMQSKNQYNIECSPKIHIQ